jgi:FHS family Na+ dependent glucose MFS transporter 1
MEELTSPLTRRRRKRRGTHLLVTIAILAAFCNGVFLNLRGPCVKDIATRAGITPAQMGWFFIASGGGGVIAALPAGKLIDHLGTPTYTLALGLVLRAVTCFVLPFVTAPLPLMLIGVAQGMTLPIVGVSLRACILWTFSGKRATPYLNLVMAAFGFGSMVAPLVYDWFAILTTSSAPLDWTFWGLACFSLLLASASLCVDRTHFDRMKRKRQRIKDGGTAGSSNTAGTSNTAGVPGSLDGHTQDTTTIVKDDALYDTPDAEDHTMALPDPPATRTTLGFFVVLNLYMAVSVGVECTVGNWLYTLAGGNNVTGFSTATWVNTTLWGSFTVTRLVLVYVLRRGAVHEKTILQGSHFIMAVGLGISCYCFTLNSTGGAEGVVYPPWALWMLTISFGIGIAPSFPNVMGLAGRLYPWPFSGMVQSTFGISANAGNGVLPGVAGLLTNVQGIGGLSFIYVPVVGVVVMQVLLMMLYCWRPVVAVEKYEYR